MKIGILAGEPSGDLIGSQLMQSLRAHHPDVTFEGIGGPLMQKAHCRSLFDIDRLSVMGFFEPLKRLPDLIRLSRDLYRHFNAHRPDIFIGIDSPDFNFVIEKKLHALGIPIVHYVSPSVWAWRQYRIHKIKKIVDLMLTLLPFESAFYQAHDVPAYYVGHPLAEKIPLEIDVSAYRRLLHLNEHAQYVALLPGSRFQEVRCLTETLVLAAKKMHEALPALQFLVSFVKSEHRAFFEAAHHALAPMATIHYFEQQSQVVIAAADAVVVKSGTATLEAMLFKKPMAIVYRTSFLTYQLAKYLVKTPHVGLPNLLANERLVPELLQDAASPEAIAEAILNVLCDQKARIVLQSRFYALHQSLKAYKTDAAQAILSLVKK